LIFLPLFYLTKWNKHFIAATCALLIVYGSVILFKPFQQKLWLQYFEAINEHGKFHLKNHPKIASYAPVPEMTVLEGFNRERVKQYRVQHPILLFGEVTNVYFWSKQIFHLSLSSLQLLLLFGLLCTVSGLFFFINYKKYNKKQALVLCCLLFIIFDYFAPILRGNYCAVQWLPIILFVFLVSIKNRNFIPLGLIIGGLLLNILTIHQIPLRRTLGELLWVIATIYFIYHPFKKQIDSQTVQANDFFNNNHLLMDR